MRHIPSIAAALLLLLAPSALADRIVTKDGRVLTPFKARQQGSVLKLVFDTGGEIEVKDRSLIRSVEVEGDMSDYVPANEEEEEKLAQGYVRYRSKWWSKMAYETERAKEKTAAAKRIEEFRSRAGWGAGWEKETPHFLFKTNTSPELLAYYSELLEAYYSLMDDRIGIKPTPSLARTKMVVNVYKSYDDFHANAAADNLGPGVLGYFWPFDKTLNFYHEYKEPEQSTWVALHECTHLLTYLVDPQYEPQIWLNEAVADYLGSAKVYRDKKGKLVIEPGQPQMDRVLTVQEAILVSQGAQPATGENKGRRGSGRGYIKLEELFKLNRQSFQGFEYAHAWSFVYFLNTWEGGKHQKAFNRFFKEIYTRAKGIPSEPKGAEFVIKPEDIRAHLLKRIGEPDVEKLEKQWIEFVKKIPIEGPVARLKRGLDQLRRLELEEAIADLDAAIESGTSDPRAWIGRAKALAFSGKVDKARADLLKALELDPLNANCYYDLSTLQVGFINLGNVRGGRPGSNEAESEEEQEETYSDEQAKVWAGLAMELDPENDYYRMWYERFE